MERNRRFASMRVSILLLGLGLSGSAAAQGDKDKDKDRDKDNKSASTDQPAIDYRHEFATGINFSRSSGEVKAADQATATTISEQRIVSNIMYGWLASEHVEPFFELQYSTIQRDVAEFNSKETRMDAGLGLLVNLPQTSNNGGPKFQGVKWIPYVGLLFGTSKVDDNRLLTAGAASVLDSGTFTKIVFGARWMLYPRISMNFGIRLLYEKSETQAKDSAEKGASRAKTQMEVQLFSLSLFL